MMKKSIFSLLAAVGLSAAFLLTASAASDETAGDIPTVCALCSSTQIQHTTHHECPWYVIGYTECTGGEPGVLDSIDERLVYDLYTCAECNWGKSLFSEETRTYHRHCYR